jgi:hypothetical protein
VRLTAPPTVPSRKALIVLERHGDTLRLAPPNGAAFNLAVGDIVAIDVSHGRSRGYGAKTGAVWGALVGAPIGLLATTRGSATCLGDASTIKCGIATRYLFMLLTAASGALDGAIIGALIGRERWVSVPASPSADARLHLLVESSRDGASMLGVSWSVR